MRLTNMNLLINDYQISNMQLLHLHVLPAIADETVPYVASDTILAIFSGNDGSIDSTPISRVVRYELDMKKEQLHPSFEQLAIRKKKSTSADSMVKRYSEYQYLR